MLRRLFVASLVAVSVGTAAQAAPSAAIRAAVADKARPAAEVARDADRKPAAMLAFAGVKPGMVVADLMSGGGYFTRVFSKAVGARGKVYALITPTDPGKDDYYVGTKTLAAEPAYRNVVVNASKGLEFKLPEQVDVMWTSQNYHDLFDEWEGFDVAAFNRRIYDTVKPGGVYIVLDHRALPGSPVKETASKLHRIDPAVVRRQVEAAGFKFEAESQAVANRADPGTKNIYDASFKGKTDQFVLKFRKPARR